MASIVSHVSTAQAARIERLVAEHRAEMARLREEFGDPEAALSKFVTDRFELRALLPDDWDPEDTSRSWWEYDEPDDR